MTVKELINRYYALHPDWHFFDKETLKFFGEKISEMYLAEDTVTVNSWDGTHECYVLYSIQHNHPNGKTLVKHYFDTETLEDIHV